MSDIKSTTQYEFPVGGSALGHSDKLGLFGTITEASPASIITDAVHPSHKAITAGEPVCHTSLAELTEYAAALNNTVLDLICDLYGVHQALAGTEATVDAYHCHQYFDADASGGLVDVLRQHFSEQDVRLSTLSKTIKAIKETLVPK